MLGHTCAQACSCWFAGIAPDPSEDGTCRRVPAGGVWIILGVIGPKRTRSREILLQLSKDQNRAVNRMIFTELSSSHHYILWSTTCIVRLQVQEKVSLSSSLSPFSLFSPSFLLPSLYVFLFIVLFLALSFSLPPSFSLSLHLFPSFSLPRSKYEAEEFCCNYSKIVRSIG